MALAGNTIPNYALVSLDPIQVAPRHRYTKAGERVDNITDWALKKFREAYESPSMVRQAHHEGDGGGAAFTSPLRGGRDTERSEGSAGGGHPESTDLAITPTPSPSPQGGGGLGQSRKSQPITKDDIFHYVYGVLHDPVYREKYALNLKREFPRIPFYPDFRRWGEWGKRLMELHIGYENVEPWPLDRLDMPDENARAAGVMPKPMLKADRDNGTIRLDSETQLSGIPKEAWDYRLGNRSGLDWILDQYREKTPKDPTIREKFNTYRFGDYKEKVADLIARVARVSVETVAITEAMKEARR
jgi:predicted helicase